MTFANSEEARVFVQKHLPAAGVVKLDIGYTGSGLHCSGGTSNLAPLPLGAQ